MASRDDSGSDDEPRRIRGRPRAGVSKPDEVSRTEAIRAKNRRAQKAYRLRCKEELDRLEESLVERRQRMSDMNEQRCRLKRRREQLQKDLERSQNTLRDLRTTAPGLLDACTGPSHLATPTRPPSRGLLDAGPPVTTAPGAEVNAAAETCVQLLHANLLSTAAKIQHRDAAALAGAAAGRGEQRSCGMPLDHGHFDAVHRLQPSAAPGFAQLQEQFGLR